MPATRPPDFLADVSFIRPDQGGRRNPPIQGYRPDIRYDDDPAGQAWMVWPRFVSDDGVEMPDGATIPYECKANFYIVNEQMRREVHIARLKPGLRFMLVEGGRTVALCVVRRLLSLHGNAL